MGSNIPGTLVAPLFAFDIQSGGNFENESRLLLIGHATSAGSMTDDSLAACPSFTDARLLAGAGSMLESMFLKARANAPAQEIWVANVAETGTAEIRTITVDSVPAAGGQGVIEIAGETLLISIAAGDTADTVAAAISAAINAYFNRFTKKSLPFTASATTDTVTLTARHKGAYASDIDIHVPALANAANAFDGNLTLATTTAGAGTPDISGVLALLGDQNFDWIVCPFNDTTSIAALKTLLNETSGRWSYAQQYYGHAFVAKTDTTTNITTFGTSNDSWHLTAIPRYSAGGNPEPQYEWLAAMAARIAPWLSDGSTGNVSRNQTGLVVEGIQPPRDRDYWPDYAARDAFLHNGISTWKVDGSGAVVIDKIITMVQTVGGVPDTSFRDIQRIGQLTYALRKFRAQLAYEHGQRALADANPGNLEALTTLKDIEATLVHTYKGMSGVLENSGTALANLSATRNSDNPNRVDVVLPLDFVNALDIFAGLAKAYAQIAA